MAKQRFLNNFTSTFIAAVKDAPSSGTPETELDYGVLRISDGAAGSLINPTGGDYYLLTAFKRSGSVESNIEVMRVTGVNNTTPGECRITVQRAQEGTSAKAFVAGDYLSLRITKGTAENFSQTADLATKEPVIAAPGSAPTEKYWRGDKTWRDFFTDVRAATLTGLSTATNAVVAATDTVLEAIGKLQAQVSTKFDKTGGGISGSVTVSGNLLATGGALGYGVGAGGTVTQTTSKSTAVALNKICGQITMHNAALAANDAVRFIVSNNLVGPADEVSVWLVNPVNPFVYDVAVDGIGSAVIVIRLRNNTATSYSDSVVIGFAVRKGATS